VGGEGKRGVGGCLLGKVEKGGGWVAPLWAKGYRGMLHDSMRKVGIGGKNGWGVGSRGGRNRFSPHLGQVGGVIITKKQRSGVCQKREGGSVVT